MREKIIWIDNLRVIATIAVIMLHVSAPILYKYGSISNYIWNIGNLFDGMVRWCVPIFFMLSGALLLNEDLEISSFLKKRLLRIRQTVGCYIPLKELLVLDMQEI